jgi:hypothetical protein
MCRGLKTISHNGADAGYRSAVICFPDLELGVAVQSNLGSFDSTQAVNKVAEVFLADKMTAPPEQPQPKTRTFIKREQRRARRRQPYGTSSPAGAARWSAMPIRP